NWSDAREVLSEQESTWRGFDPTPENNNRLEWGLHKILSARVEAGGFREFRKAQAKLEEARKVLAGTLTARFQSAIAEARGESARLSGSGGKEARVAALDRRLLGPSAEYYFFGRD